MEGKRLTYKEAVTSKDHFSVTWELVPGRGATEKAQDVVIETAKEAADDPRISAFTMTENPSGKPAILPHVLATEVLKETGVETLVHFTCKDKNRNEIESQLHAMSRAGLQNLLVMTGDYTTEGFKGRPKPVFDIDAVHAVKMIKKMNEGYEVPIRKGTKQLKPTDYFAGAVVSPFKATEPEQMAQYYKMQQKYDNGAEYFITQLGFDARKFDEVRRYMKMNDINVPLIGNIYVLSMGVAKLMNKNMIPGCVVTDQMLADLQKEKEEFENNKERQLLRSAKLYAVLKGMGYDGVTIAGHGMTYEELCFILDKGEELLPEWESLVKEFDYPMENGFYYFEKDEKTGLNTDTPVDRSKTGHKKNPLIDRLMFGTVHHVVLSEHAPFYPLAKKVCQRIDKGKLKKPFTWFEYYGKTFTNECRFCGDCVMHEIGYTCPMSKCPKNQRNGACGGSRDGWCEVYPGTQKCIYVTMYEKYKAKDKEYTMKLRYTPPVNWDLYRTSSWLNFFCERDYNYRKDD
ncbi:MAG TPA: methylenetetrahydrofolate reductase [Eubacteriaceae bacterium]|nr:methylenetetrahydrofolate reductase [Eubacteriaceae bacterium]